MFSSPDACFGSVTDPRRNDKNKIYKLSDLLFIMVAATISGITDWVGMETWAESKQDWLGQYIDVSHGTPSHDTFRAVAGRINPVEFNRSFTQWVQTELPNLAGLHIAVDGKALRGSRDEQGIVHMVSAFATKLRVVLTQQACADKSNEITAIPDLLNLLELKGAVVTIDAMGCQKSIAKQIVDAGCDYVLAIKENQPTLYAEAKSTLDAEGLADRLEVRETVDRAHGRLEVRSSGLSLKLGGISKKDDWAGLAAIGVVEAIREVKGTVSVEPRYFITSITDPVRFQEVVRDHWAIETSQHLVLDVQFGEDANRTREKNAATNLAIIRRMSLNMFRRNADRSDEKRSIRSRKIRAAADDAARARYLFGADYQLYPTTLV
jgi:predicted transposase YbfD/YdcC